MAKNRRKADGTAFENEFRDIVSERFYVKRLPTLNTGFSGLRQPADFIVVGSKFNYVECKETTGDRFSIGTMEQYDLMLEFILDRSFYTDTAKMEYYVIVHYLSKGIYKVVNAQQAHDLAQQHKSLKYDSDVGITLTKLEELGGIEF